MADTTGASSTKIETIQPTRTVTSIVDEFDKICFEFGDQDAILMYNETNETPTASDVNAETKMAPSTVMPDIAPTTANNTSTTCDSIIYIEIQEYSKILATQLAWRYRPDYILMDCQHWPVAEAVTTLASMRLRCCPFIPVSCFDLHRPGRMEVVVDMLRRQRKKKKKQDEEYAQKYKQRHEQRGVPVVVAVTVCDDDFDPILSVFQQAGIHQIIKISNKGILQDQIQVPESLPRKYQLQRRTKTGTTGSGRNDEDMSGENRQQEPQEEEKERYHTLSDDLYILFTSGTSGVKPKAVIGSHQATIRRMRWFIDAFSSSLSSSSSSSSSSRTRIARRTKLTFVDGITELWTSLLDISSILVAMEPYNLAAYGIEKLIETTHATQILLLPSQLSQLLTALPPPSPSSSSSSSFATSTSEKKIERSTNDTRTRTKATHLSSLQRVLISGEPCSTTLVERFCFHFPSVQLLNLYGQTETTGDITCAVLTDYMSTLKVQDGYNNDDGMNKFEYNKSIHNGIAIIDNTVAVGTPIGSTVISLDPITSELIISGGQLSNGYLEFGKEDDEVETTKERRQPFLSFATGDVGFCRNGVWYVRGRLDHVRKINGIWTCPTEIEAAFSKMYCCDTCTTVKEVAAVIISDYENYDTQEAGGTVSNHNSSSGNHFTAILCTEQPSGTAVTTSTTTTMPKKVSAQSETTISDIFSRENMYQAGIPWNLIPHQVIIVSEIPNQKGGANKVNRKACMQIALDHRSNMAGPSSPRATKLEGRNVNEKNSDLTKVTTSMTTSSAAERCSDSRVTSLVCQALDLPMKTEEIDSEKSFVELGGDSAKAITLLYLLRNEYNAAISGNKITALDLLSMRSLKDLISTIQDSKDNNSPTADDSNDDNSIDTKPSKRQKTTAEKNKESTKSSSPSAFSKKEYKVENATTKTIRTNECQHTAISLMACVDATPLLTSTTLPPSSSSAPSSISAPSLGNDNDIKSNNIHDQNDKNNNNNINNCTEIIYAACQGGVLAQISAADGTIVGHRQWHGWSIQADPIRYQESIIVSVYNDATNEGNIIRLSENDLNHEIWNCRLDGTVKCTPVMEQYVVDDDDDDGEQPRHRHFRCRLWVVYDGIHVTALDANTGNFCLRSTSNENMDILSDGISTLPWHVKLTNTAVTRPVIGSNRSGDSFVIYASSDWDTGLMAVNQKTGVVSKELNYEIGPVHKDLQIYRSNDSTGASDDDDLTIMVADSYGSLHTVDLNHFSILRSWKLSNFPLSSPVLIAVTTNDNTSSTTIGTKYYHCKPQQVLVGSYDGMLRCIDLESDDSNDGTVSNSADEEFFCGASIVAAPALCSMTHVKGPENEVKNHDDDKPARTKATDAKERNEIGVIVCTTAGDILCINLKRQRRTSNYYLLEKKAMWRYQIDGEIWSNPVMMTITIERDNDVSKKKIFVTFGARDSCLHLLEIPAIDNQTIQNNQDDHDDDGIPIY